MKKIEISLTDFIDFVNKSGTSKTYTGQKNKEQAQNTNLSLIFISP